MRTLEEAHQHTLEATEREHTMRMASLRDELEKENEKVIFNTAKHSKCFLLVRYLPDVVLLSCV